MLSNPTPYVEAKLAVAKGGEAPARGEDAPGSRRVGVPPGGHDLPRPEKLRSRARDRRPRAQPRPEVRHMSRDTT